MIPRTHRLDRRGVESVLSTPSVYGDQCAVKMLHTPGPAQIAIVIPKKIVRKSVDRHRVKRRVAHALYALMSEQAIPKEGYKAVIFPKGSMRTLPFPHIQSALLSCLKKAGV